MPLGWVQCILDTAEWSMALSHAPVQLEALSAQVASLRGQAAEAGALREQVERLRGQWQEAESRLSAVQVKLL